MNKHLLSLFCIALSLISCDKEFSSKEEAIFCSTDQSKLENILWVEQNVTIETLNSNGAKTIEKKTSVSFLKLESSYNYIKQSLDNTENGNWSFNKEDCTLTLKSTGREFHESYKIVHKNDSLWLITKVNNISYTRSFIKEQGSENPEYPLDIPKSPVCEQVPTELLINKWYNTKTLIEYVNLEGKVTSSGWIYPEGFFDVKASKDYHVYSNGVTRLGIWEINENTCQLVLDKNRDLERYFDVLELTSTSLIIKKRVGLYEINTQYYTK